MKRLYSLQKKWKEQGTLLPAEIDELFYLAQRLLENRRTERKQDAVTANLLCRLLANRLTRIGVAQLHCTECRAVGQCGALVGIKCKSCGQDTGFACAHCTPPISTVPDKARPEDYFTAGRFRTTEEAAKVLRVSVKRIRKWCASGRLSAKKVGRKWLVDEATLRDVLCEE